MAAVSELGRFEFYLAVVTLIYWSLNKRVGVALAYTLSLSDALNAGLKHFFRDPRPYWLDPSVKWADFASYGLPSGHSQGAAVFYLILAGQFAAAGPWLLALALLLLMGLSRVYLGVHDIPDTLIGAWIGASLATLYFAWERHAAGRFSNRILGQRLLYALLPPLGVAAVYLASMLLLGPADRQVAWSAYQPAAERESLESITSALAGWLGLSAGFVLESGRVRFASRGPIWKRLLRFPIGLAGTLLLWRGLALLFPADPLWLALPLRFLRLFLAALWVSYYGPWLFVKLRLAEAEKPETRLVLGTTG